MIGPTDPRLVAPAVTVVLGTAIAVGAWIGSGWGAALGIEVVTMLGAVGYFVLGGRDSDLGALFGSRPDERQAGIGVRATVLTGVVLIAVAIGGVVISSARGRSGWPFVLFSVVGWGDVPGGPGPLPRPVSGSPPAAVRAAGRSASGRPCPTGRGS